MKNGNGRFEFYLEQIDKLLRTASTQKDPALWLYTNGARTPIFMIEGLAKLYGGIHNEKAFAKIDKHFKILEDALGGIDYYDAFAREFAKDKKMPAEVTKYVQSKAREKVGRLNEILAENEWLKGSSGRITKIRKKLKSLDWMKPKAEMDAIERFYHQSIKDINGFWAGCERGFTNVESQVHELRRKLRWLSIYPQALRGCVQLKVGQGTDKKLTKYLTPEIVTSPFNKLPEPGANTHLLMLNQGYFLALSWLIATLGQLKDEGLRAALIAEARGATKAASKSVPNVAEKPPAAIGAILTKASKVCRTYFDEGNLDKLVAGTVKA